MDINTIEQNLIYVNDACKRLIDYLEMTLNCFMCGGHNDHGSDCMRND